MFFRQYDLACLSVFSYLIGDEDTGRAVVVDPRRDISEYLDDASTRGLQIERVIETHFHADFLSGHLELAAETGALISYGNLATTDFPIDPLADGQILSLGQVTLEIRHTPGHTPEAISIVIRKRPDDVPWGVLTGDTLLIGDVGRPDLLTSAGRTADSLARDLYHSLHTQVLTLPDATLVYPAHGAGSACGKQLSTAASSTIGEQRNSNYAVGAASEDEFVAAVTEGQTAAPLYFAFAADANRRDHDLLDDHEPPAPVSLDDAVALGHAGAVLLDTRPVEAFATGHARGSINVGLDGRFAEYAGDVIRPGLDVVVLGDRGRGLEARVRLARIGLDNVVGAVDGITAALAGRHDVATPASRVTGSDLVRHVRTAHGLQIIDVRNPAETTDGMISGARNLPLAQLIDRLDELDPDASTTAYCASGYRSSAASSTLRAHGFGTVADLIGGYDAWTRATRALLPPPTTATKEQQS